MKIKLAVSILLTVYSYLAFSQRSVTISGYLKDSTSGEALPRATVYVRDLLNGTVTNDYGFYSLVIPAGEHTIEFSYMGYEKISRKMNLTQNQTINQDLVPLSHTMKAVVISAQRGNENVSSTSMGSTELNIMQVKKIPSFFGEADLIKTIQLLPGVQSAGEGNSGYFVRGGGLDQNLILLDEALIYNAGHLFGFFSIFNADVIRSAEMIKSNMPAYYGGRLASVLDITMKEGNNKKYELEGGIGLIFARLSVQGPIKKNKASFLFTGRRTYIDALIQPFLRKESPAKGVKFYFYDLNGKINWAVNDKHHLYLSGYYGVDAYGFNSTGGILKSDFHWQNASASFRWNYNINSRLFLKTMLMFSNYNFGMKAHLDIYGLNLSSGIQDYRFKSELTIVPRAGTLLKTGVDYTFHRLKPNSYIANSIIGLDIPEGKINNAHELAVYLNDEWDLGDAVKLNLGLRGSYFCHVGEFTQYKTDNVGRAADSVVYSFAEKVKDYWGLEPRVSVRFAVDKTFSIKASYVHNYQYLHQVAMSSISLPTDMWMVSTEGIKPQIGDQYSVGVYKNLQRNEWELSVEAYYKDMKNLAEYVEGFSPLSQAAKPMQAQYTQGDGYAYGVEFFVNKTAGQLTGWIGYALSWSRRTFSDLNGGMAFNAKNDRRHDISLMLSYDILPSLTASMVWVYATGNTMTIPVGFYFIGTDLVTEYSAKNAFRTPAYHRMDISLTWNFRKRRERLEQSLNFSVYNVYNRKNPFFISIGTRINQNTNSLVNTAYKMSLFPIMPSISWNFKFK
jgi:outer membrane receptor for ferrienterochelin and colicin